MAQRWAYRLGAVAVLALATILRFYRLNFQSLWSDEGNSVALARTTLADITARTALDIHPPLYYWLLKGWTGIFGYSEFAVRSLSAVLGVLLVAGLLGLGITLFNRWIGLAAALLAATHPFLIYYSQEARMYTLLALLATLTVWLAVGWWQTPPTPGRRLNGLAYGAVVTAGLYTQYAFPVVLLAVNLAALLKLWSQRRQLLGWIGLQAIPVLLYLPWLPTAWRQLTGWSPPLPDTPWSQVLATVVQTLAFGPVGAGIDTFWLWIWGAALFGGVVVLVWRSKRGAMVWRTVLLLSWLLLPVGLTIVIFRPAYLKFMLVAVPPVCLLLAITLLQPAQLLWQQKTSSFRLAGGMWAAAGTTLLLIPQLTALQTLYTDSNYFRDNYRGIAQFIRAVGGPNDAVVLNAPGQQEVFGYYYPAAAEAPLVYPLPQQRPINPTQTETALANLAAQAERIYAVYWATDESDPQGIIETWLDNNTFKASDTWFGNVRLVSYAAGGGDTVYQPAQADFGEMMTLTGFSFAPVQATPGQILRLGLQWQALQPLDVDYVFFAQLLDGANNLVGQRDAAPTPPTSTWTPGQPVEVGQGLTVAPGTPPGNYRLVVGWYNPTTGERLRMPDGSDFLTLNEVNIVASDPPLPPEAIEMQSRFGEGPLLGYDVYPLGQPERADAPLPAGHPLHLNLYWQNLPAIDQVSLKLVDQNGVASQSRQVPPFGDSASGYQAGPDQVVRGQFNLFLEGVSPGRYRLQVWHKDTNLGQTHLFDVTGFSEQ